MSVHELLTIAGQQARIEKLESGWIPFERLKWEDHPSPCYRGRAKFGDLSILITEQGDYEIARRAGDHYEEVGTYRTKDKVEEVLNENH